MWSLRKLELAAEECNKNLVVATQLILFFLVRRYDATNTNCLFIDISVSLPPFQQGKQNKLISMSNCIWWLSFWNIKSNQDSQCSLPWHTVCLKLCFLGSVFCLCLYLSQHPFQLYQALALQSPLLSLIIRPHFLFLFFPFLDQIFTFF